MEELASSWIGLDILRRPDWKGIPLSREFNEGPALGRRRTMPALSPLDPGTRDGTEDGGPGKGGAGREGVGCVAWL